MNALTAYEAAQIQAMSQLLKVIEKRNSDAAIEARDDLGIVEAMAYGKFRECCEAASERLFDVLNTASSHLQDANAEAALA